MAAIRFAAAPQDGNPLALADTIQALEAAGVEEMIFRFADGRFVPDCLGGFELIRAAVQATALPVYVHLLCESPDRYVKPLADTGCKGVLVHQEACTHGHRTLNALTAAGLEAGLAVNPATPLTKLNYLLPYAARVLVLAAEHGAKPGTFAKSAPERIRILSENIRYHEYPARIQASGGLTPEHAARCARFGASVCVLPPSILAGGVPIADAVAAYAVAFEAQTHLV